MNTRKIFSFIIAILGEVLMIICLLHFGKNLQSEILITNIIISTIIYCLFFADILFPWINLQDKTQKQIGSIGLRWVFSFTYLILAVGIMIYFNNIKPIHFTNQILFHAILLFFLLIGLFLSYSSSDKVREVYYEEKQNRDRIEEMKKTLKDLQNKIDSMNNIPQEISSRINDLQENLRYISPSNNSEALNLENKFIESVNTLTISFSDNPLNMQNVIGNIKNCERIYKERKQVFSN